MSNVNETAALKTQLDAVIEQMNALRLQLAESSGQQHNADHSTDRNSATATEEKITDEKIATAHAGRDPPSATDGTAGAPAEDEPAATSVLPLGTDHLRPRPMLQPAPLPVLRAPRLGRDRAAPSALAGSTAQRVAQEYNTPNAPLLFLAESEISIKRSQTNIGRGFRSRRSTFVGTGVKVRIFLRIASAREQVVWWC